MKKTLFDRAEDGSYIAGDLDSEGFGSLVRFVRLEDGTVYVTDEVTIEPSISNFVSHDGGVVIVECEWYETGIYDGSECRHCGRQRVMKCDAPDNSERRVCEKCGWDQEADDYAINVDFPI